MCREGATSTVLCLNTVVVRGAVAQSVERAPGKEVAGSISAVTARSLLVGSVSLSLVSVLCDRLRQKSWTPRSVSCVAARKIVRRFVLGPDRDVTFYCS